MFDDKMNRAVFLHSLQAPGAPFYETMPVFAALLREQGLDLTLFTPVDAADIHGVCNVHARWDLGSVPSADLNLDLKLLKGQEPRIMEAMMEFAGIEPDLAAVRKTRAFWQDYLKELRPAAVLVCEVDNPHSLILSELCRELKIPYWHLAKGVLDKTWQLDPCGHVRSGSMMMTMNLAMGTQGATYRYSYDEIRDYFVSTRHSYYPHENIGTLDDDLARALEEDGGKVVLLLGGGWMSATNLPEELGVLSPVFRYTAQMLEWFVQNLETFAPGSKLVFKNHPGDKTDYSSFAARGVIWLPGVDFKALLGLADVAVSLTTILQFEALLREIPQVVLTNSELTGKGIVYEALEEGEIGVKLQAALRCEGFASMKQEGREFLERLANLFLIGIEEGMPCGFGLGELSQFLARFKSHVPAEVRHVLVEGEPEPQTLAFLEVIHERKRLLLELEAAQRQRAWDKNTAAGEVKSLQKEVTALRKELLKLQKRCERMKEEVSLWNGRSWLKRAFYKLRLRDENDG